MPITYPPIVIQAGGNTAGATANIRTGTFFLAGGNNITLSQNGNSITISGGGGGAAGSNTLGMSNLGNTSGTSGIISGSALQFIFAGGNNVTLSQSINGSSATITISAFNQVIQSNTFGMSNLGNTSGTSGVISGSALQMILVGGNNITLSQSINGSSATITISAAAGGGGGAATISNWPLLYPHVQTVFTATINSGGSGGTGGSTQWTYSGRLFPVDLPAQLHWNELYSMLGMQATSAGTGSATQQVLLGIYTLNANTAMSLSTSYVWSMAMSQNSITARTHRWGWGTNSTSNSSGASGNSSASFSGSRIALANQTNETLSAGRYYFCVALLQRTSSSNVYGIASMAEVLGSASSSGYSLFGRNNLSQWPGHWGGVFSTTTNTPAITVTAMPASIHTSVITRTDNVSRWRPVFVQLQRSTT